MTPPRTYDTHAIQVGTPLENVLALFRDAGSLC